MLDDLRQLRATLDVAIGLLERLEPVLAAWKRDAVQEAPGSLPDVSESDPHVASSLAYGAHHAPAGAAGQGNSQHQPLNGAHRACAQCGGAIVSPKAARFCSTACRMRHHVERTSAARRAAKAAVPPAMSDQPCPVCGGEVPATRRGGPAQVYCGGSCKAKAAKARRQEREAAASVATAAPAPKPEPSPVAVSPAATARPARPRSRDDVFPRKPAPRDPKVDQAIADISRMPAERHDFPPGSTLVVPAVPYQPESSRREPGVRAGASIGI